VITVSNTERSADSQLLSALLRCFRDGFLVSYDERDRRQAAAKQRLKAVLDDLDLFGLTANPTIHEEPGEWQ
jgi:hypothetical protein